MYSNIALRLLKKNMAFFIICIPCSRREEEKILENYMRKYVELYNLNCKGLLCNFSFYSERSQDSKRLNEFLSKITYLINGKAKIDSISLDSQAIPFL